MNLIMNTGSVAIIVMGSIGLMIRWRHYQRYGELALAGMCAWAIGLGAARLLSGLDVISTAGVFNSWWSLAWAWTQAGLWAQAEYSAHYRKQRLLCMARAVDAVKT